MNLKLLIFMILMMGSKASFALYGSKPLAKGEFGFVGSLHIRDMDHTELDYFCSASLISPKLLVTAAHCIEGMGREHFEGAYFLTYFPEVFRVRFGTQTYRVKSVRFSASYFDVNGRGSEDLALIELKEPVTGVTPVKLHSGNFKAGQSMTLVARGKRAETTLLRALRFRQTQAVLIETDGTKSGTCGGDSGGALLTKENNEFVLVGVLTYDGELACEKKNTISYGPRGHY